MIALLGQIPVWPPDIFPGGCTQAFIQPKILARLDWDSARGNAPKLPVLYYVYGSICKFSRA